MSSKSSVVERAESHSDKYGSGVEQAGSLPLWVRAARLMNMIQWTGMLHPGERQAQRSASVDVYASALSGAHLDSIDFQRSYEWFVRQQQPLREGRHAWALEHVPGLAYAEAERARQMGDIRRHMVPLESIHRRNERENAQLARLQQQHDDVILQRDAARQLAYGAIGCSNAQLEAAARTATEEYMQKLAPPSISALVVAPALG